MRGLARCGERLAIPADHTEGGGQDVNQTCTDVGLLAARLGSSRVCVHSRGKSIGPAQSKLGICFVPPERTNPVMSDDRPGVMTAGRTITGAAFPSARVRKRALHRATTWCPGVSAAQMNPLDMV